MLIKINGLHQGCDILANCCYVAISAVLMGNDICDYCFFM